MQALTKQFKPKTKSRRFLDRCTPVLQRMLKILKISHEIMACTILVLHVVGMFLQVATLCLRS